MDLLRMTPPPLDLFQRGGRGENKAFSQMMQVEKFEYERAKGAVASLISSYNSAKSPALQEHIVRTMKGYYGSLSVEHQRSIDPYIAHGPTSEMAEKKREFIKHNPPPEFPLYEGDDNIAVQKRRIEYLFQEADWNRSLKSFMFGADAAGDKQNFLSLPDNQAALRNKQGQIMFLSQSDLKLNEMSEKYDIPVKDILLRGGVIPTGTKGVSVIGGRKITTENTLNLFAVDPKERYGSRITSIESAPKSAWDIKHPAKLTEFLLDWKARETDNETVEEIRKIGRRKPKMAQQMLSEIFPQYSFRVVSRKRTPFIWNLIFRIVPFVSADPNLALIPIRGRPTPFTDQSGKRLVYYYDQSLDLVSNEYGVPLGSYGQVSEEVKSRVIGVKKLK